MSIPVRLHLSVGKCNTFQTFMTWVTEMFLAINFVSVLHFCFELILSLGFVVIYRPVSDITPWRACSLVDLYNEPRL